MTLRRLLVVDDDTTVRLIACAGLESMAGWQASAVGSGAEGLTVAAAEQPDAILLDVQMPDLDGPATFAKLQADPATREIPVIFLTATQPGDGPSPWDGLDIAGVLQKPFDPVRLPAQIAATLGWTS